MLHDVNTGQLPAPSVDSRHEYATHNHRRWYAIERLGTPFVRIRGAGAVHTALHHNTAACAITRRLMTRQ